ncbi:hypothetical protein GCM10027060_26490 [Nesterenkonia halophila]
MSQQGSNSLAIGGVAFAAFILGLPMFVVMFAGGGSGEDECVPPEAQNGDAAAPVQTVSVDPESVPGSVAGWQSGQLENAAVIIQAGADMGLSGRDQAIAVMTAMGESSLENIDYGDDIHGVTNPDGSLTSSIGLFQQQKWWGTASERMDPYQSAQIFYEVLETVDGRNHMAPTMAAHEVQRNAVANHYQKHWDDAVQVTTALADAPIQYDESTDSGSNIERASSNEGAAQCPGGGEQANYAGDISDDGWAFPTEGNSITSVFGMREHPVMEDVCRLHAGIDLDGDEGDPLYAAYDGTVTNISWDESGGWMMFVDMADNAGQLRYMHIHESGGSPNTFYEVGDQVEAGDNIAELGNTGISSGPHLHFEVHDADGPTNPIPVLEDAGFELHEESFARDLIVESC